MGLGYAKSVETNQMTNLDTQIAKLIDKSYYGNDIETTNKIKKTIYKAIMKKMPKKWKNTRKTMLPSWVNGDLGFHTGSGFDHTTLTIGTLEEYGNSHQNEVLLEFESVIKDLLMK